MRQERLDAGRGANVAEAVPCRHGARFETGIFKGLRQTAADGRHTAAGLLLVYELMCVPVSSLFV